MKGYLVRADHSKIAGSDHAVNFSTALTDTALPTISLTAPTSGATVSGVVTLLATASDDTGIAGVQFRIDSVNTGAEDITPPYSVPFNSTNIGNGLHSVTAVARDLGRQHRHLIGRADHGHQHRRHRSRRGGSNGPGRTRWAFVAIHVTLLANGNVLAWDDHTENQGMYMWHPTTGAITTYPPSSANLWCSGHTMLPDGRLLIAGGTGNTFNIGLRDGVVYNPVTDSFSAVAQMTYARYYPTLITLADGNALVFSGTNGCSTCLQNIPERYNRLANTLDVTAGDADPAAVLPESISSSRMAASSSPVRLKSR